MNHIDANKVFLASILSFLIINLFENILYYSIGRSYEKKSKDIIFIPSFKDLIKILLIMFLFAILQGLLTIYFEK